MANELSEIEARLLLEKLDRRTRAIVVLRGKLRRFSWPMFLLEILFAGTLIGLMEVCDGGQGYLLPWVLVGVAILALLGIMETFVARLDRRIDALVELLQQEGMLRPELPPERAQEG